jgi:TolB-like protein/DNA-binding winged helix-turn-helix (wHTH) protein/cytochrome c-type biogenesis protein CcmH/NrfG
MHGSFDQQRPKDATDAGRWSFGRALFDETTGELLVDGEPRPLDHGSHEILRRLLWSAGEVVPKDVLLQAGWPGRITSDSSLTKASRRLRISLDDPDGTVVATVHGYGYRLAAHATRTASTSSVDAVTHPAQPPGRIPRPDRRSSRWLYAGALVVLALVGLKVWPEPARPRPAAAPPIESRLSVAVLPFRDLSKDGSQAYIADGMTEELLNRLAQVPRLRVIGKSSVFSLQGKDLEPRRIGELLHVTHYVEGSVRSSGQRLRVTIHLRKAIDGTELWSSAYDRELGDVLVLQDEIAAAVTRRLELQLLGVMPSRRVNPEAYALVQRARRDFRMGVPYKPQVLADLEKAVALDPDYGEAWYVLATTYLDAHYAGQMSLEEAKRRSRQTSEAALARNPRNALVLANMGFDALFYYNDMQAAIRYTNEAMSLDPTDLRVLWLAATIAFDAGQKEEAIAAMAFVADRDPLHGATHQSLGMHYLMLHRYADAVASFRTSVALNPDNKYAQAQMADALLMMGDATGALAAYEKANEAFDRVGGACAAYYALGRQKDSDACMARLEGLDMTTVEARDRLAKTRAYRGEADAAFKWLATFKYEDGNVLDMDPFYERLHADPRWLPQLRKHGRAPEQLAALPRSNFNFTAPVLLVEQSGLH